MPAIVACPLPYLPWSAGRSPGPHGPVPTMPDRKGQPVTRSRARAAVFLATLALGCTTAAVPALASARPAPAPAAGQAASGWLARQLVKGTYFDEVFDGVTYPEQGETIDAIFAFAATHSANRYGANAIGWLARRGVLLNYIGVGTESYAGATAKVILAAEVRGRNPADFGGVNLLKRLAKLMRPNGRYSDHSVYGDYSNAFSQSLAIIALSRAGGAPAKAVKFLLSSECKNGGFPLYFAQKTCVSDTDSTAMDVQALLAAGRDSAAVRGLTWLARVQHRNGGLDAAGGATQNANTTGLAGEAFAAGKWHANAASARRFLLSLQVGCSAKAAERGAIAYDRSGFDESTAVDATAQGLLGVADVPLLTLSSRGSLNNDPRLAC
jgi:hypothetical protein